MQRSDALVVTVMGVLLLGLMTACSDEDPVSPNNSIMGSGNLTTEARTVAAFHSVDLSTVGTLNVSQGIAQEVSVTVDDNIQQHISTSVTGGVLDIFVPAGVQLSNFDLTVDVTMIDIKKLAMSGVGSLSSAMQIQIDTLDVELSGVGSATLDLSVADLHTTIGGVGSVSLTGSVTSHEFTVAGDGDLVAFGLATDTTLVAIGGVGTAELVANDLLDVIVSGQGTVSYKGRPAISVDISGTGQLIDAN